MIKKRAFSSFVLVNVAYPLWLGTLALILASTAASQEPLGYFVTELRIDNLQHLVPSGSRSQVEPVEGAYYSVHHTGTGFTSVAHIEKKPGAAQAERLFYLETNTDQILDRTVKEDEILKGPFGTVYVEKTCFFNRPVASNWSHVTVMTGSSKDLSTPEIPAEFSESPKDLPPLTSFSVVRVFREHAGYVLAAANYESSGELGSLNIAETKDGYVIPGHASTVFFFQGDWNKPVAEKYGVPLRINVQEYLHSRQLFLPNVALEQEFVVVNQHFGFDKLIRQEHLDDKGTVVSSRYLRPFVTEEENSVESECSSRFRQQQAMALPTVE